jgi:hypothetical protein
MPLRAGIKIEVAEVRELTTLKPPRSLLPLVTRGLAAKHAQIAFLSRLLAKATAGTLTFREALAVLIHPPAGPAIWTRIGVPICQY